MNYKIKKRLLIRDVSSFLAKQDRPTLDCLFPFLGTKDIKKIRGSIGTIQFTLDPVIYEARQFWNVNGGKKVLIYFIPNFTYPEVVRIDEEDEVP